VTPHEFLQQFGTLAESPQGVPKLRELILELAVRGKLTERADNDEPVPHLLDRIKVRRDELVADGVIRARIPTRARNLPDAPLPVGWEWHQFGDLTFNRDGDRVPVRSSDRENQAKTYDYYGASGVIDKVENYIFDQPLLLIGEDGANLINRATPIAFIAEGKYWVNNHAHVVDAISREMLEYLRVYFASISLEPYITGMAQPKMNQAQMNSIPIAVPPIQEQHRIVAKVDELMGLCDRLEAVQGERRGVRVRLNRASLDRLTSSSTARGGAVSAAWQRVCDHFEVLYDTPETLPDLRQTILQLAVQGKLVPQNPNDEPAINDVSDIEAEKKALIEARKLRQNHVSEIEATRSLQYDVPDSWRWFPFGDVVFFQEGPGIRNWQFRTEGVKLLNVQNIVGEELVLENTDRHVSNEEFEEKYKHFAVENGDILFASSGGSWGKTAWFEDPGYTVMLNTSMIRLKFFSKRCVDEYLMLFLRTVFFRTQMEIQLVGMQPNFGSTHLGRVYIPLPPLSEQKRIVSKVTHLLSQVTRLESTLTRREATRTQLLTAAIHALLNGDDK